MHATKTSQGPRQKNNGIGDAEIAPGVAAGTTKGDLKTPAAERLIDIRVRACAIDYEKRPDGVAPRRCRKQMPHAAKIAFAFITHVADEKDVCSRPERRAF